MSDTKTIRPFLSDDHLAFAARLDEFVRGEIEPYPDPDDDDAARGRARELVRILGGGGWFAPIRDQDWRSMCLAREGLAAGSPLADAVYALQGLATTPLLIAGDAEILDRYLPGIVAGKTLMAFALTEREAGSDVAAIATTAERDGDEYVLNGQKTLISNAGIADLYVVFASTDPAARGKGLSCFVVPAKTTGLEFTRAQTLSAPHPLGEIEFDRCRVPAGNRLGEEGKGMRLALATLDRLRPTVGAAACGMAARALREALAYSLRRRQFGSPISSFQIVQEKLGRMATELAASRLLVYRAAWEKDSGAERITVESAMAKAFATEAAQRIVDDAVQILGGRGVVDGHPVDHLYRAVRASRIYEGTTEIQHLIIAGELLREEKDRG